jgi:hypothetical protein
MFAIVRVSGPAADLQALREVFQQNIIPRLMKEFFYHMSYGKQKICRQELKTAPLEKLTRLINITAFLLQTKVYLFWKKTRQYSVSPNFSNRTNDNGRE